MAGHPIVAPNLRPAYLRAGSAVVEQGPSPVDFSGGTRGGQPGGSAVVEQGPPPPISPAAPAAVSRQGQPMRSASLDVRR